MHPNDVLPEIIKRIYAGAVDEAMDLYAEDCVMIEKPNVMLRGKEQIRQSLQSLVSSGNILSVQMRHALIAGDIAYSISDWKITFGGATVAIGQATDLLRRTQNGDWLMLLDNPFGVNAFTLTAISIRRVQPGEEHLLWQIFYASVHEVACSHYLPAQLDAWAPDHYPGAPWVSRIQKNQPFVAELNGRLAGFADVQPDGYVDHFFVAGFAARQGVGSRLMQQLHTAAVAMRLEHLYSEVSLSAQAFFARAGFKVEAEQTVVRNGVELRNSRMRKDITHQPDALP